MKAWHGRGRIRTRDRALVPREIRVSGRGPLGYGSGMSRVGFEPTQGWLKASCPTVLGDRLMGPSRFERPLVVPSDGCFRATPRARRSGFAGRTAPLVRAGHRRHGGALTTGGRATRPSGSRGASAIGAGSRGSASSGIRSPPSSLGLEPSGQSESNAHPEFYGLECCRYTMPRPTSRAAEHGEHPLSIRWEARHGPFRVLRGDAGHGNRDPGGRTYFNVSSWVVRPEGGTWLPLFLEEMKIERGRDVRPFLRSFGVPTTGRRG